MDLFWCPVLPGDRGELARLDRRIKRVDGAETISDLVGDALSAQAGVCVRLPGGAVMGVGYVKGATLGGGVDPDYRRRGLGRRLLAWTEAHAPAGAELTIRNEALTPGAHALYLSRGFEPRMVEARMMRDAAATVPDVPPLPGVETLPWSETSAGQFFAAYRASFADRPGVPDPSADEWIEELASEDFQPDLSRVAIAADKPVGFVTARLTSTVGWIDQIGVAPGWRRRGLGRALLAATLRRFQTTEVVEVFLHVNTDNPRAAAFYNRLGFRDDLQRARYTKQSSTTPADGSNDTF